jgi:hypothetical protein
VGREILSVFEAFGEDLVCNRQGQSAIGAGVRAEVEIGVARRPAAIRIHHDQFGAVIAKVRCVALLFALNLI